MKKNVVTIMIIFIIIIILLGGLIFLNFREKLDIQVLSDNNNQVEVLNDILREFLNEFNMDNNKVCLDDSCLKNIITGNEFEEAQKNYLKSIEIKNSEYIFLYKISIDYDNAKKILNISLDRDDGNEIGKQKYKIYVNDNRILYEKYGFLDTTYTTIVE